MSNPRPPRLEADRITEALAGLPGWDLDRDRLHRLFEFADFPAAFGFMASCALIAEATDHHPEWTNVYRRVEVWLTTHDAGGITEKDLALARAMDERAAPLLGPPAAR